ncbi:hypothetical protein PHAVU_007G188000 [Phaseolus vulgaris]|uniref:Uncharacterized protein n=1 Tax=Phaseolus vulgaris TaxID=3885 RepID=V7BG73_PHAVU|nr:hypothetical protein PHAVU_007G188000g [Phaseolus vulgaris]ESW16827.1 hypothetical protein PHAVU_007G188000g [Phaseolus vulgaris]
MIAFILSPHINIIKTRGSKSWLLIQARHGGCSSLHIIFTHASLQSCNTFLPKIPSFTISVCFTLFPPTFRTRLLLSFSLKNQEKPPKKLLQKIDKIKSKPK